MGKFWVSVLLLCLLCWACVAGCRPRRPTCDCPVIVTTSGPHLSPLQSGGQSFGIPRGKLYMHPARKTRRVQHTSECDERYENILREWRRRRDR